jgi:hypothetical protein
MLINQMPYLENRDPHGDAQGFGLVGTGHGTPVIVGQNNHGPVFQRRVEHPFAGYIKIVAVHQGKYRHVISSHHLCITRVTIPQISNAISWIPAGTSSVKH